MGQRYKSLSQKREKALKNQRFSQVLGAVEKTRTSTGCPTATSTLRVYQFRHDRIVVGLLASAREHLAKRFGPRKSAVTVF